MKKPERKLRKRLERLVHFDEVFPQKLSLNLTADEITNQLIYKTGYDLYLNKYTKEDIKHTLVRAGIWDKIRKEGFKKLMLEMDTRDPYHQRLCLYFDEVSPKNMLAQIILSTGTFVPRKNFVESIKIEKMNMLIIEWLCLQNPLKKFTDEKPQLPGQDFPGLGVGRRIVEVIKGVAEDLNMDGILNYPQYYHNAVMYSEIFRFYNPVIYGRMLAIKQLLSKVTLAESAWIVHLGCIIDENTGKRFEWKAEEMILPISKTLVDYFSSEGYNRIVKKTIEGSKFSVDTRRYEKLKDKRNNC